MDERLSAVYAKKNRALSDDISDDRPSSKRIQASGHETGNRAIRQNTGSANEYSEGTRVRHRKFGDGTVVGVTNVGKNSYLVIDFDKFGKITLSLAFAPIEKI